MYVCVYKEMLFCLAAASSYNLNNSSGTKSHGKLIRTEFKEIQTKEGNSLILIHISLISIKVRYHIYNLAVCVCVCEHCLSLYFAHFSTVVEQYFLTLIMKSTAFPHWPILKNSI